MTNEIRRREADLEGLRRQAETWSEALLGKNARAPGRRRSATGATPRKPTKKAAGRTSGRVSWEEVLASLPTKFGIDDVLKHPGARAKGRAQVYPALTRWTGAKKVKKIGKGRYQKL